MAKQQKKRAGKAKSTPSDRIWTPSNMLSFLRVLLVIPFVMLLENTYANQLWLGAICMIAYGTDLLDGWIARKFEGESKLGRIIDPLADKLFITVAVLAMVILELLPLWFVVLVVLRDVIIFIGGMHLRQRTGILVQSNMLGKATVVAIGLTLLATIFHDGGRNTVQEVLIVLSVALIVVSLYKYGERYRDLLRRHGKKR
ncbi:MAG: CDP-alcohol phosphatidyltransferase family protein [Bacteroidota bacterium]|nr:CDP-alcohol phosphatidyltransferase family protein [Bacteroidota bacterium]